MKTKSTFYKTLEHVFPHFRNICVVTNCFPPCPKNAESLSIGGIFKKYESIADELRHYKKGLSVISLYYSEISKDQDSPYVSRIGVYRPYKLFNTKYLYPLLELFNPLIFSKCLKIFMRQRPDLVIIGSTYQMSLAPILAAKVLGIEVVIQHDWLCPVSPKNEYACGFFGRIKNCGECLESLIDSKQSALAKVLFGIFSALMLLIKRAIWNRCIVFVESNFFKDFYVKSGIYHEQNYMVPPSATVDNSTEHDQDFMNELEERLGNAKIVAYIGRICREKGIELLLQSYNILKGRTKDDIKLVVAGDGLLRDAVKKKAKVNSSILYLGWLPKQKLKCVYLLADIIVIPSISPEAYPHVAIEALSFGKNVIGFRMGGLIEIAKENNLITLVENIDAISLAEAIAKNICPRNS